MKALLVIDMQEEYVGEKRNKKLYKYDTVSLINKVNSRIKEYNDNGNIVIYIRNKFFWQAKFSEMVMGLDVISDLIFDKKRPSCFSNPSLIKFIKEKDISIIEVVGVDGNYCVGKSALAGRNIGLHIIFSQNEVGISNKVKFIKMGHKLLKAGVQVNE